MSQDSTHDLSYFAQSNFRSDRRRVGIKQRDRLYHMYLLGKTGVGKSTLIETLALQDLDSGRGFAVIDPHGDLADSIAQKVPARLQSRLIYFNASDRAQSYGYNPLRRVASERRSLAASGLLETLKNIWSDAWGVRMEHILRNALLLLLEQERAALPDILRLLDDAAFRKKTAAACENDQVKRFWLKEYQAYTARYRSDSIAPIQNKIGALLADPLLYRILVKPEHDLHFRHVMDSGNALLVNLATGKIGHDSASLLGSLVVTTLGLAAFSRADLPEGVRRPFFLYIDEFQTFVTVFIANMISELRKYGVGLILAHQHLEQLQPSIRHAVLGNSGTLIVFRVGPEDAALLAKELQPRFRALDLLNLSNREIYLKLMIEGTPSQPFSAMTLRYLLGRGRNGIDTAACH